MFRRNFGLCRRLIVILLAFYVLISIIGPLHQRIPKDGEKTQLFQAVNYTACGRTRWGENDIVSRLTERIRCRNHSSAQSNIPSSRQQASQSLFITHDLFNAVGLGNFMFMAATTLGLAQSTGRKPFFVDSHHHMSVFEPKFPMLEDLPRGEIALVPTGVLTQNVIEVKTAGIYDPTLQVEMEAKKEKPQDGEIPVAFTLRGYLQSWRYFHQDRAIIQRQFTFSAKVFKKALGKIKSAIRIYVERTKETPTTIVGVHVRRGDILKPVMKKYGHTVASKSYLLHLTSNMTEAFRPVLFIVVSNDQPYCQSLFHNATNVVLVDGNPPEVDMAILSLMDHLILTVGSFGWWGAYLSDAKDIYYYRHWPTHGSLLDREYNRKDYFLDNWKPFG